MLPRALLACLLTLAVLVPVTLTGTPNARADSAAKTDARAKKLLDQVNAIQKQVDAALASYDTALSSLATAVGNNVTADTVLGQMTLAEQAAHDQAAARIRAIYRSGGTASVYATILDKSDPADVLARVQIVKRVVSTDQLTLNTNRRSLRTASSAASDARNVANARA